MPFVLRTLVSAVADGRGIGPWLLIFAVGLGVGFGTRGGWLAGLIGVVAAHVRVGYVKTINGLESGRDAIDFAEDGLILGVVLFTPAICSVRRRDGVRPSPLVTAGRRSPPTSPGQAGEQWSFSAA